MFTSFGVLLEPNHKRSCPHRLPVNQTLIRGDHYDLSDQLTQAAQPTMNLITVTMNKDGTASTRFSDDRFSANDLFDADGSAVIVHAGPDNYGNIPTRYSAAGVPGPDAATLATGDSGARLACGVIKKSK